MPLLFPAVMSPVDVTEDVVEPRLKMPFVADVIAPVETTVDNPPVAWLKTPWPELDERSPIDVTEDVVEPKLKMPSPEAVILPTELTLAAPELP